MADSAEAVAAALLVAGAVDLSVVSVGAGGADAEEEAADASSNSVGRTRGGLCSSDPSNRRY